MPPAANAAAKQGRIRCERVGVEDALEGTRWATRQTRRRCPDEAAQKQHTISFGETYAVSDDPANLKTATSSCYGQPHDTRGSCTTFAPVLHALRILC